MQVQHGLGADIIMAFDDCPPASDQYEGDPAGYAGALEQCDVYLGTLLERLGEGDLLLLTADHGNDPTFTGSDHTREYVPLLGYRKGQPGISLGMRDGFYDVAQSLAAYFGIAPLPRGTSFLG